MLAIRILCIMLVPLAVRAGDWTEFRGPTGQGIAEANGLPTEWSPSKNVAWKIDLPGKGWSSPIVLGDRIYLTTAVEKGDEQELRALCLTVDSGKIEWDVPLFTHPNGRIHGKNSHASPTPITDGKHVWVHFGTHGTACLGLDGTVIWKNTELKYSPVHGNGGSPVLVDGKLIVSCDGSDRQFVAALDQKTGTIAWEKDRPRMEAKGFSFSTPLLIEVNGKKQVISAGSGVVQALHPKDGEEIWRVRYGSGYSVVPRPVFGHGLLILSSGYDTPKLLAIRPDGMGDVTDTHVAWTFDRSAPRNASPIIVGDEVYAVSDNGVLACLDVKTGKEVWRERITGDYSASPVFADGKLYFQNEKGIGVVLKPGKEFQQLAKNDLEDDTLASYALAGNALLIRTKSYLYKVAAQ